MSERAGMPVEKCVENWTKFPNCILDNIDRFSPVEFKILGLMVRKNVGYSEPSQLFSVRYICKKIGHKPDAVLKAVNGLVEKESVRIVGTGKRGIRLFDVNWTEPKSDPACGKNPHGEDRSEKPNSDRSEKPNKCKKTEERKHDDKKGGPSSSSFAGCPEETSGLPDGIPELVPAECRKPFVLAVLERHTDKGKNYLREAILYANANSARHNAKEYAAYLGKTLENGWARDFESAYAEAAPPAEYVPPVPSDEERAEKLALYDWHNRMSEEEKEPFRGEARKERPEERSEAVMEMYAFLNFRERFEAEKSESSRLVPSEGRDFPEVKSESGRVPARAGDFSG